jgi:hypothetical protein
MTDPRDLTAALRPWLDRFYIVAMALAVACFVGPMAVMIGG